ncbi:MAG TPA: hypothetical protein VJQ82_26455 [Terriglobales bacterium]|nr:hypothetical protein [Terriglobales bacterium]
MPTSGLLTGNATGTPPPAPALFPGKSLWERLQPMAKIRELYERARQPVSRSLNMPGWADAC